MVAPPYVGSRRALRFAANPLSRSLLTGLVAYWPLDEASGTRRDLAGNGLTLTDNNTVLGAAGPSGKLPTAGQFTAANSEYLSRATHAALQTGDIDFTTAMWVRPTTIDGTNRIITMKGLPATTLEYYILVRDTGVYGITMGNSSGDYGPSANAGAPVLNTWSYLIAWHNSLTNTLNMEQYRDGALISSGSAGTAGAFPGVLTGNYHIGAWISAPSLFWDGQIAGVPIWKRLLSATERSYMAQGRQFIPGRGFV